MIFLNINAVKETKLILQCSRPKRDAQKGHCGIVVMPTAFKFFYILDQALLRLLLKKQKKLLT